MPLSVHPSTTLSPPKPLGRIQPNLLHAFPSIRGIGVQEQHYFSIRLSVHDCPSFCLSGNWIKLATWLPLMVRVCISESLHSSIHPSILQAISNISMEHGGFAMACHKDLKAHSSLLFFVLFFFGWGRGDRQLYVDHACSIWSGSSLFAIQPQF